MAGPDAKFDCEKGGDELPKTNTKNDIDTRLQSQEPFHVAVSGAMLQTTGALSFLGAVSLTAPTRSLLFAQRTVITSAVLTYLAGLGFVIYAVRSGRVRWSYMFFKAILWADACMKLCMWTIGTSADWRLVGACLIGTVISVLEGLYLDNRFEKDESEEFDSSSPMVA